MTSSNAASILTSLEDRTQQILQKAAADEHEIQPTLNASEHADEKTSRLLAHENVPDLQSSDAAGIQEREDANYLKGGKRVLLALSLGLVIFAVGMVCGNLLRLQYLLLIQCP